MRNCLFRTKALSLILPLALLASAIANADTMAFSYTFEGTAFPVQTYAAGSTLSGQIDGTVDPMNPDRVIINSFYTVVLSRTGMPVHTFADIDNDEFNTHPYGNVAVMSFSGLNLDFRACPNGFTQGDPPQDCQFHTQEGFLMTHSLPPAPGGVAHAADSTDDLVCDPELAGSNRVRGCRVTDFPIVSGNWSLIVLPNNADVDPTVIIGGGTTIESNVEINEGAVLGENVLVDKNTSIGADTTISDDAVLGKNVDVGSGVMIGSDGMADHNVLIEDGVTIGDNTSIDHGTHICSGATIGSFVTIGKNNLILDGTGVDVPDGIVLDGFEDRPGECP